MCAWGVRLVSDEEGHEVLLERVLVDPRRPTAKVLVRVVVGMLVRWREQGILAALKVEGGWLDD